MFFAQTARPQRTPDGQRTGHVVTASWADAGRTVLRRRPATSARRLRKPRRADGPRHAISATRLGGTGAPVHHRPFVRRSSSCSHSPYHHQAGAAHRNCQRTSDAMSSRGDPTGSGCGREPRARLVHPTCSASPPVPRIHRGWLRPDCGPPTCHRARRHPSHLTRNRMLGVRRFGTEPVLSPSRARVHPDPKRGPTRPTCWHNTRRLPGARREVD